MIGSYKYKHVIASFFRLATGAENIRVLNVKRAIAAWEKTQLGQISDGTELYVPPVEFGFIASAAHLHLQFVLPIAPVCMIHYFSLPVQDRSDDLGGIALHHRFCAAVQIEMELRVIEGLAAKFASRE